MAARDPTDALAYEIAGESAATMGRLGRRLEASLAALAAHRGSAAERDALIEAAGESLWFYVIQRELIGCHDHELAYAVYGIPAEVRLRMGPRLGR